MIPRPTIQIGSLGSKIVSLDILNLVDIRGLKRQRNEITVVVALQKFKLTWAIVGCIKFAEGADSCISAKMLLRSQSLIPHQTQ